MSAPEATMDPAAFLDALRASQDVDNDEAAATVDAIEGAATAHVRDVELVVDRASGRVRQAGADSAEGAYVVGWRERAEKSLYFFAKAILGRDYLTPRLHKPLCDWLQTTPPHRKGALLPREHAKTTIVAHALPLHIHIQPKSTNIYFPGEDGANTAILLAGENERRVKDAIGVHQAAWEGNALLRAFWPHRVWQNVRRDAPRWNDVEYTLPRTIAYPDPSLRGIGVGGAITGAHPRVLIKDDLISVEAANSDLVMSNAINWHIASRALVNRPGCLEFIIGTRWAVYDLYSYIQQNDPTVDWITRAIVENGRSIYPEGGFNEAKIAELKAQFGTLFPLLYMNSAADPSLADFAAADLRRYTIEGDTLIFDEDGRDAALLARSHGPTKPEPAKPRGDPRYIGRVLDRDMWDVLAARNEYLRLRRA